MLLFAEFTDQNERQGEQPLRYTFITEESEVESCSGRKTAHLLGKTITDILPF